MERNLSEEDKEWIENLITKSHDGRLQSFSGMFQSMTQTIKEQSVKIEKLDSKIDEYIKDDIEWKKDAKPIIKAISEISGTGKIVVAFAIGIGAIAAAIIYITQLFHR